MNFGRSKTEIGQKIADGQLLLLALLQGPVVIYCTALCFALGCITSQHDSLYWQCFKYNYTDWFSK